MAIIQISRIQVRRGKENNGTGVPRLASGEFGWAVDTQRLFIGPGSEAEGSPDSVNNVRILTEKDNILSLADQYIYRGTLINEVGEAVPIESNAVSRTLQNRLDDFVSASNFGIVGDGLADDTLALQAAVDALFSVDVDQTTRSVLYIPAGTYFTTQPLQIPPFAQITGAGIENTVIVNNGTKIFEAIGNVPSNSFSLQTQPRHIKISNLSMESDSNQSAVFLHSCRDSEFRNLKLTGTYNIDSENNSSIAFELAATSNGVTCKNNLFENMQIEKFSKGIYSPGEIINNTFKNMVLYELENAFEFGEEDIIVGPNLNIIENCNFELIYNEAISVLSGEYNTSRSNRFINVGNDSGGATTSPVINFVSDTNISVNDYFDRTEILSDALINSTYFPEVQGRTRYENLYLRQVIIGDTVGEVLPVFRLPVVESGAIFVDYVFLNEDGSPDNIREGMLKIVTNGDTVIVEDEFTSIGDTNSTSLSSMNFLEFSAAKETDYIMMFAKNNLTNSRLYYTIKTKT